MAVSPLSQAAARERSERIRGCHILALVFATLMCGPLPNSALAAMGPLDESTPETTIRPRTADPMPAAARLNEGASRAAVGNPLWAIPLDSLTNTRERPLFSPSRRPPAVAVAAPPPTAPAGPPPKAVPDNPPLKLVGTVIGDAVSMGIFIDQGTSNIVRLRTGEGHAGWTLASIAGRDATFEKDHRQVTLALPARNGTEQTVASKPAPMPVTAQTDDTRAPDARTDRDRQTAATLPPTPVQQDGHQAALPPGTWLDGDGQPISPPPRSATIDTDKKSQVASWVDGDGLPAGPPPAQPTTEDGKPLGPAVWLDGYGRPIGPAPTAWPDGDGQSISPPPYRWLDQAGKPIIPPPFAWRDGDGQFISAPPQRVSAQ
jgi:general secretion pathway protein N